MAGAEGRHRRVCQFNAFNHAALYAADVQTLGELGGQW